MKNKKLFFFGPIHDIVEWNNLADKNKISKEEWFKYILERLKSYESEQFPNFISYKLGLDILFDLDKKKDVLWCDYDKIWSIFVNKYGLIYNDIQPFIKNKMEEYLKLRSITPIPYSLL